jgi:DNA-binding transcriptional LysR family regulator
MANHDLDAISAFADIVRCGSFRAAANERGVTASALSHAVSRLERHLGVRLLTRTTRAVALTDAGERLLSRAGPALADIAGAVEDLNAFRDTPSGRVRITAPRMAAATVLARGLASFVQAYPSIQLEISVADGFQDLAMMGFDAGVRFGEALQPNMVAVPVSGPVEMVVVGAPTYLAAHAPINVPQDLRTHACIGIRLLSAGALYAWEFQRDGVKQTVNVAGPLIVDDQEMVVSASASGVGLGYTMLEYAQPYLDSGQLVRVLPQWTQVEDGFFLYYPSRKNIPAALRAVIGHWRYRPEINDRCPE